MAHHAILAYHAVFVGPVHLLGLLGDVRVDHLYCVLPFSIVCFDCVEGLMVELGIIINFLSSTDGSGILCQIVLSLLIGLTHVQQVSGKVGVIEGQYILCCLVGLFCCSTSTGASQGSCQAVLLGQKLTY